MNQVELSSVCEIKNGFAFKSSEFQQEGTPLIRISSFDNGPVYFDDNTVYVDNEYLNTKSAFKVEQGDVLIALSGATTGKYGIYTHQEPSLLNQRIGLLKSGTSEDLDDKYFYHYLSILKSEILRKAGGAAQPNISTKAIGELKIPLPPLDQQKKIAAILDAADAYRQKTKALIAKYDELTQSLFLDNFGDPVLNPKNWETDTLENIADYFIGLTYKPADVSKEGTIVLRSSNIQNGELDFNDIVRVQKEIKDKLFVQDDDILMCSRNGSARLVGKVALISDLNEKMTFGAFMTIIRSEMHHYLLHYFRTQGFRRQISTGATTTVNQITKNMLNRINLPIPPKHVQNEFVEKIQTIESQKAKAQESLAKAEELFNSLLQRAFKGELC
ncbi:MAG: hypothetical protein DCO96_03660 [Fluviicola sp. XM-24bin1]|nr:MAG: hypothetical protein DCO96_03660 [Fluviicola sp. XM-24bin1]